MQKNTRKKDSNEKAKVVPTKLNPAHRSLVAFLFDLDGTLIDTFTSTSSPGARRSRELAFPCQCGAFTGESA